MSFLQSAPHAHKKQAIAFFLMLFFSLLAYASVVGAWFSGALLVAFVVGCALLQTAAQIFLSLQIWKEPKPHWNAQMAIGMFVVTVLIVVGSLWIMANLDYNVMPEMHSHLPILESRAV